MGLDDFKSKLANLSSTDENYVKENAQQIVDQIHNGSLKVIELVKHLDPVLTDGDHQIRLRGVEGLTSVVVSLDKKFLSQKEIEVLKEFLLLRLVDHKTMEEPVLKCLAYFVECDNKPPSLERTILEFIKTKTNFHKMENRSRLLAYDILKKIIVNRRKTSSTIDSDLIYSLAHMFDGESNPENLMSCFGIVSYVLKNFQELEPFVDDLFEWLSSYYPIDYTPNENDQPEGFNITRSDLVQALYDCFYANQINAENLQTLLLEKLESSVLSIKLESLCCLIKCYEVFPVSKVKDYASSLWTAVRMDCLKKTSLIDPQLMETSYKALSALSKNLNQDHGLYFAFIGDMYEELSIAFRKPEMDLFVPASRLLAHSAQPKLAGFNYVLSKILPLSMDIIEAGHSSPIIGLTYFFEQLLLNHPGSKLDQNLNDNLNKISLLASRIGDETSLQLLNAIVRLKIELKDSTLDLLISRILSLLDTMPDVDKTLALICANYNRYDIIFDNSEVACDFESIIKLVDFYFLDTSFPADKYKSILTKFWIYLRYLILVFDLCDVSVINNLDQRSLNHLLIEIRSKASDVEENDKIINYSGQVHAIVLSKIQVDHISPLVMNIFGSSYCQNLIPTESGANNLSYKVYLPVLKWVLKSLVVRNHPLSQPIMNLVLNFQTSEKVHQELALHGCQVFRFVLSTEAEDYPFDKQRHYQVFALWKQKFYNQTSKEIIIRYNSYKDDLKKYVLICNLASQIPKLSPAIYKNNFEWLLRELLKILSSFKSRINCDSSNEEFISAIYECTESLIRANLNENLSGHLGSLIDINLFYSTNARTLRVRVKALACLANLTSFPETELMNMRSKVIDRLKSCLADKKRLVRRAAAEARLKWILVGQPVGS